MRTKTVVFSWCLLALILGSRAANAGTVLIKADEAALPPAPAAASVPLATRGLTRHPNVIMVSPVASVTSPFTLELRFQAHGGSKIKLASLQVIYLKNPNVDLTGRVTPFLTANGVDMVGAEAPLGKHMIKVNIADSDGRKGSAVFTINVIK